MPAILKLNNHGRKLINICTCKQSDIIILNGRVGNDASVAIGDLTCKDKSTVVLCLCSISLLSHIYDFKVLDFNECFSDVHCPIEVKLTKIRNPKTRDDNNINATQAGNLKRPLWEHSIQDVFKRNLDEQRISVLCNVIDEYTAKTQSISQIDIDNVYNDI